MRFVVDAQLSPAVAWLLRDLGHDAIHVMDCLGAGATDSAIWSFAIAESRAIVTKDDDFAQRTLTSREVGVVWIRIGNCANAVLLQRLRSNWSHVDAALSRGDTLIEIV